MSCYSWSCVHQARVNRPLVSILNFDKTFIKNAIVKCFMKIGIVVFRVVFTHEIKIIRIALIYNMKSFLHNPSEATQQYFLYLVILRQHLSSHQQEFPQFHKHLQTFTILNSLVQPQYLTEEMQLVILRQDLP